jgi:excisionase family DNA binding protein
MSEPGARTAGADNEIMTLEEVAAFLRLKPQTIYKWAQEKRIPAAKLGKEWRFRRSLIELWLDEQMIGEGSGFTHLRAKRSPSPQ